MHLFAGLACYAYEKLDWRSDVIAPDETETCQEKLARILYAENVTSLEYRYKDPADMIEPFEFSFTGFDPTVSGLQVIKAVGCYHYQSCEHPTWEKSHAKSVTDSIVSHAITTIPGYRDGVHGWPANTRGVLSLSDMAKGRT